MNKQTSVNLLVSKLNKEGFAAVLTNEEIQEALQMEREQIEKAIEYGFNYGCRYANGEEGEYDSQPYYEQTYGGNNE